MIQRTSVAFGAVLLLAAALAVAAETAPSVRDGVRSYRQAHEREILAEYNAPSFRGTDVNVSFRPQLNVDGSNRFFGTG